MDDFISRQAALACIEGWQDRRTGDIYPPDELPEYQKIESLPAADVVEVIRCKDCKHRMPYDWMFSEIWQSQNMDFYPEDEIGCAYCDMHMRANDFCSRAERK